MGLTISPLNDSGIDFIHTFLCKLDYCNWFVVVVLSPLRLTLFIASGEEDIVEMRLHLDTEERE